MPLMELVADCGGKIDTTFWDLENSYVGWGRGGEKHDDHIVTDLLAPTTNIALLDDVIGATESDHLPIICVTNHPRLASRNKGPMRFDASRVRRGYRFLRDPVVWAESGDLACAIDISRNAYGAMYIGEAHGADCHRFGKPMTGEQEHLEPSDLHDLKLIEAAIGDDKTAAKSPRQTVVQGETEDQAAESEAQDTEADGASSTGHGTTRRSEAVCLLARWLRKTGTSRGRTTGRKWCNNMSSISTRHLRRRLWPRQVSSRTCPMVH